MKVVLKHVFLVRILQRTNCVRSYGNYKKISVNIRGLLRSLYAKCYKRSWKQYKKCRILNGTFTCTY